MRHSSDYKTEVTWFTIDVRLTFSRKFLFLAILHAQFNFNLKHSFFIDEPDKYETMCGLSGETRKDLLEGTGRLDSF